MTLGENREGPSPRAAAAAARPPPPPAQDRPPLPVVWSPSTSLHHNVRFELKR